MSLIDLGADPGVPRNLESSRSVSLQLKLARRNALRLLPSLGGGFSSSDFDAEVGDRRLEEARRP